MTWASWTTSGVIAGAGGVVTDEIGVITGELTVHTTWTEDQAHIAVQYTGALDWFTLTGSPVPAHSEAHSRAVHQAAVDAVRAGGGAVAPAVASPAQR
ncbi:hypothetical protein [Streptomyces sp. MST-110588]|uniref:hypothetical protein n=1 Tax=Streptomyces sp. MST-110588 TaxID=2833628 RepID=UPI001F5DB77D|nr:hypothetical protein [Streptomyces sp. MST-110588]UNO43207.1 hypothetical protein KGS77_31570 [Streptomyces sp. MST-110588]